MASSDVKCANTHPESKGCEEDGRYTCRYTCKSCQLVTYCGSECQKSHWPVHKIECKSSWGKASWTPDWVLKNRKPAFIGDSLAIPFGGKKYLWGNVPAFDVLKLASNEGDKYGESLNLLFAASGDLRNVIKTVAQIPSSYRSPLDITINDHDLDIVARNTVILLIALVVDDVDAAIDCIIHVWYSAFIRKSDLGILQKQIKPLITSVCDKIKSRTPTTRLGKTWKFGNRSLRLVLEKSSWDTLLSYMNILEGLTANKANNIRKAITLSDSRQDYRDRHMLFQSPSHRIAHNRYWGDGLLVPFGTSRHEFEEPNPTFFQTVDTWPLKDNANPLNGWSLNEIDATLSAPASSDIYGKLFYHVRSLLRDFLLRISGLELSIHLFHVDAKKLPNELKDVSFSRIEVSNIADTGYVGLPDIIKLMIPLLEKPAINPHATLVILLMNAIDENMTDRDIIDNMKPQSRTLQRVFKYIPWKGAPTSTSDPNIIKFSFARDGVATYDHIFDRYMKAFRVTEAAHSAGAVFKEEHTVIEKWPFRLKLTPCQSGAQEEFERLMRGGSSGKERYMECKRVDRPEA